MACRSVSSFVSRDLDPRLSDAVIKHSTASVKRASRTLGRRVQLTPFRFGNCE
jgi:hypothetical protein